MAVNIGPRIGIEGEAEYRKQLQNIIQTQKTLNSEMKAMESAWDKDTSAKKKAADQTSLLNNQISTQKQRIAELKYGLEQSAEKYGENDTRTLKWKQALADANAELSRMENELRSIPNSLQIYGQKLEETGQKIKKVGNTMTSAGRSMSMYVTAPIVAAGTAAVKVTSDFDTSMSKVMSLTGATGDEFQALRDKARQMGATTKFSAGEAADALSYMALAGWDTDQMMEGLDGVMNLAASSGMDLADASDLVTDYLSAFGLEAKDATRMADELAYAQANSNTTTTQLGEAFGNSAAQMNTAGQSMETTTAILEAFANQGLKGSEAGTALSAMMRDITQKMKDGKIMIGDTAVQVMDANGNFRDMTDILADVEAATDGMGSAEKSAALMTTFTARSVKGVSMALNEGSSSIKKYRDGLYNAGGTAKNMADIMQDNLSGPLTMLKSQLSELGISFGDILVPHIRKAVEWIQKQVDKFNSLDDATKEQIIRFAALAAAIGPVLLVGGKLVAAVGSIVEVGGKALSWLGGMTEGSGALVGALNPLGLAFGAVAGFAAIAYAGYKDLENQAKSTNEELYDSIGAVNETTSSLESASKEVKDGFEKADKAIKDVESTARAATKIADKIDELTSKTSLNADEQNRLKVLVEEMNQLYPEMNLAIDETGQSLNMTTGEIKDYIDQIYKMQKAAVYAEALKTAMENMATAEFELAKAGVEHDRLLEEQQQLEQEVKDKIEAHKRAAENLDDVYRELTLAGSEANLSYGTEKVALQDATEALEENEEAQKEANQTLKEAQQNYDDSYAALEALADELGVSVDELLGMESASESAGEAVAGMGDDFDEAASDIDESMQKIIDAYERTAESAKQSVMDQKTAFEEFTKQDPVDIDTLQQNLDSVIEAYSNYNTNAQKLTSDARYGVDRNYTAMVNAIGAAGIEAAPKMQAIVDALDDDGKISELSYGYAVALGNAAQEYGVNMGLFESYTENGIEATEQALEAGGLRIEKASQQTVKKATLDEKRFSESIKGGKKAGEKITSSVAEGEEAGNKAVVKAGEQTKWHIQKTITGIKDLSSDSEDAGETVTDSTAIGIKTKTPLVDWNMVAVQETVAAKIRDIKGLPGKEAGESATGSVATGISNKTPTVAQKSEEMKGAVKARILEVRDMKSIGVTAGESAAGGVATGVSNKQTNVNTASGNMASALSDAISKIKGYKTDGVTAGETAAGGVATGIGNKKGEVSTKAGEVKNAAYTGLHGVNEFDSYTWGVHAVQNLINGLQSQYEALKQKAQALAQLIKSNLGFTRPEEGPLREGTEIWGKHMVQGIERGMQSELPNMRKAVENVAYTVATIPTSTMLDIDAMSGRNVTDTLTLDGLFDVISAAVSNQEMTVQIGNREFARILREQGAIA